MFEAAYIDTHQRGELAGRVDRLRAGMAECDLCPRQCGLNRTVGELGFCRTGPSAMVSSYGPHFGEEDPLVGRHGSGTIFLTHCNLGCVFCQNWDISHEGEGHQIGATDMAAMMLSLQAHGCHNINFVTPTHALASILEALVVAADSGLRVPLVYNCGGYESIETLELLDGVFDIYMPDFKFWDEAAAEKYCQAADYPERARQAILEMHRQTGDLTMNADGVAERGLLIRHLVMPGDLAGSEHVLKWLADEVSADTYVNVMDQYRPCGQARMYPELDRRPTSAEYSRAVAIAREAGLRLDDRTRRRLF